MEPLVVALVLAAAAMHATWNTLIKLGEDRLMAMALVMAVSALLGPLLVVQGPPPAPASWPFIALSVAIHSLYFLLLVEAYRVGDLSHAYPLARGSAPLLVAAGSAVFAGEVLSPAELAGVAIVSAGIISLMAAGGRRGARAEPRALAYPLATGATIAAYTVADGLGVRLSASPAGYIGWLFIFSGLPLAAVAIAVRRRTALGFLRRHWRNGVVGGVLAFGAYALAIWALSLGAMAHVSALRETGVVIAALIGTRLLGEPFGVHRVLSAATVAGGVVLIHLAA